MPCIRPCLFCTRDCYLLPLLGFFPRPYEGDRYQAVSMMYMNIRNENIDRDLEAYCCPPSCFYTMCTVQCVLTSRGKINLID